MKKNILIVILILIASSSMTYAYIKAKEAGLVRVELSDAEVKYDQLKNEAERQAEASMQWRAEAMRQEALAVEYKDRLSECEVK